jgi:hypothetical protein
MTAVVAIVEGDGEVAALPVLLRRLSAWLTPGLTVNVRTPIRVHKDRFLNRPEEFSRHLQLAAKKCGDGGWVLILLDADDDCPAVRGAAIAADARRVIAHRRFAIVLANREYEAWFIAASDSLNGHRGFVSRPGDERVDAETPRDAKGWLKERMNSRSYGETTDQPAFSACFDLMQARQRSRSFRKLCDEWSRNCQ